MSVWITRLHARSHEDKTCACRILRCRSGQYTMLCACLSKHVGTRYERVSDKLRSNFLEERSWLPHCIMDLSNFPGFLGQYTVYEA